MKVLIQLGADTMLQDKDGRTVLHTIVQYNGDLSIILQGDTAVSFVLHLSNLVITKFSAVTDEPNSSS